MTQVVTSFPMEHKDLFVRNSQYHGCWWPGDARSQGINSHGIDLAILKYSGPWFHTKMSSYQYRKSHCGDKTVVRSSYLHNGISYTGKMASLYWTSNGSWCMGIKGEMSGTVCVTFTWDMYIYIWVVYSLCFFCCLFITVTWWYVWCFEWASGNQEEVQACLVTLWLFIISCYSLYKTTLGLLCSWFENNPHFHKYSMDFHV